MKGKRTTETIKLTGLLSFDLSHHCFLLCWAFSSQVKLLFAQLCQNNRKQRYRHARYSSTMQSALCQNWKWKCLHFCESILQTSGLHGQKGIHCLCKVPVYQELNKFALSFFVDVSSGQTLIFMLQKTMCWQGRLQSNVSLVWLQHEHGH